MNVRQFVQCHNPWTDGSVRIERLAKRGGGGTRLPLTYAHVVTYRETGDHWTHRRALDVSAACADDDRQFPLIVQSIGDSRHMNIIVWTVDAGDLLVEPSLVFGRRHDMCHFFQVGPVAATEPEELSRPQHWSFQSHTRQWYAACTSKRCAHRIQRRRAAFEQRDHISRH